MFLTILLENWDSYGDLSKIENFRRMYDDIIRTHYFEVRVVQGMEVIQADEWYSSCDSFDPAGVILPVIRHETAAPHNPDIWLGDKSPNYTTHVLQIKTAIPEAKIIHIVRDVRDAALSARKIWHKNVLRFAQRWIDGLRILWKHLESVPDTDYLEIRYEDLLEEPSSSLRRITNFLGLEFDENMLVLSKPAENFGDAKVSIGILSENTGKYRTQLSVKDQRRIEEIAQEALRHYHYECDATETKRLSRLEAIFYLAADVFNRFRFDLRLGRGLGFVLRSTISRVRMRL